MSEELDDSAFCPVCFECYSELEVAVPRLLPCSHTMCHACVDKLIKNSTLVCPQDRKAHPALSGVLSFPQNKYVLKMMTQGKVSNERMTYLKSQASLLIKQLGLRKGQLIATKQKVNQHGLELAQKLKQARDELDKEFDGEIKVIDENIEKLNEICQEISSDLTKDKKVIERLQKESKEKEQEKYKFYDLIEISRDMEPPEEIDIKYYEKEQSKIEVTRTLKLGISVVTGIHLMSNGTLVSYGHGGELQRAGAHSYSIYRFCQHKLEKEQLIYSKKTKTTGAIEIISDRKPTLLLSDGTNTLRLFDASNLAKCTGRIDVRDEVGFLFHDDPGHVICEIGDSLYRRQIADAKTMSHPWTRLCNLPPDRKDMCLMRDKDKDDMIFFLACPKAVSAWNQDDRLLWSFSGAPTGMRLDINPTSITLNQEEQRLYVCDSANRCIQIISTDGVYLGSLVRSGKYGLGKLKLLRWCTDTDSLLIVHRKAYDNHVSVVKVQSKKEHMSTSSGWTYLKIIVCLSASMIMLYLLSIF